jgi:hypothetical protein
VNWTNHLLARVEHSQLPLQLDEKQLYRSAFFVSVPGQSRRLDHVRGASGLRQTSDVSLLRTG